MKTRISSLVFGLLLSVSTVSAWTFDWPYLYYDNSQTQWLQVMILWGHSSASKGADLSQIDRTLLWYARPAEKWENLSSLGFGFCDCSGWGKENVGFDTRWGYVQNQTTKYTGTIKDSQELDYATYYFTSSGSSDLGYNRYEGEGYGSIPKYTTTVAAKVRTGEKDYYTLVNGTWPSSLTIEGTYLSGQGATGHTSVTGYASTDDALNRTYGSVVTGLVELSHGTVSAGYVFEGWGTGETPSESGATYSFNQSENTTVYAFYTYPSAATTWQLKGSWDSWAGSVDFTKHSEEYNGAEAHCSLSLEANTSYGFKFYNSYKNEWYGIASGSEATIQSGNEYTLTSANGNQNGTFTTQGAGTYSFTIDYSTPTSPKVVVTFPTSHQVHFNASPAHGSVQVVDGDENVFSAGQYVVDGGTLTFTATPDEGYRLEGWYTASDYATLFSETNPMTFSDVTEDANYYALFAENLCSVTITADNTTNGSVTLDGEDFAWGSTTQVGVQTTRSLVVTPADGYFFSGWSYSDTPDFSVDEIGENGASTTLRGTGGTHGSIGTLTAHFTELNKVYFDNSQVQWASVYVYFGAYWTEADGASRNRAYAARRMTEMDEGVYWAYVPREITRGDNADNKHKIAFSETEQTGASYYFANTKAAQRDDYFYNGDLNLYRPCQSEETQHGCTYYKAGYWVQKSADEGVGVSYYMKLSSADDGTYEYDEQFTASQTGYIRTCSIRLDQSNHTFYCRISTGNGSDFKASTDITNINHTDIIVTPYGSGDFRLTTTAEGVYTFTLDQSSEQMRLSVDYPASVGDYRLVYQSTTPSQERYSDIIKHNQVGSPIMASMFIHAGATGATLNLQKCTAIVGNSITWTDTPSADLISLFDGRQSDVYQFDVTISDMGADNVASSASCVVENIASYTGNYYIKTNCATGGWTAYTSNIMGHNTINFDRTDASFDYYYCAYIGNTTTNVKFVIANEYNNALSDTISTDDYVTDTENQTLPVAANVRFSFNTATCTARRAYLRGSNENDFLNIVPAAADYVFDGATDLHGATAYNRKFADNQNWIYQKDVQVKPNAQASVTAIYNGQTQTFIPEGTTLMGGEGDNKYTVRIIYDFKTNHLLTAWLPSTIETDLALNSDVMIERYEHESAAQITFVGNAELTDVETVYTVMQFRKSFLTDVTKNRYYRDLYMISFPYDVKLSNAFGFGTYGKHWIIQYYDGASRAANGCWVDSDPYWKYVTDRSSFTLKANTGYVLALEYDSVCLSTCAVWNNGVETIALYFPSSASLGNAITKDLPTDYEVPEHPCTITRDNRHYKDANWNLIGVPSYSDTHKTIVASAMSSDGSQTNDLPFLYQQTLEGGKVLQAQAASLFTFQSTHAYLVQYAGVINWQAETVPTLAPNRVEESVPLLRLEIQDEEQKKMDHTFIRFTDDATAAFDLNKDLTKVINVGKTNVYTFTSEQVDVAGNNLPLEAGVTTIPVGVRAANAGSYVFAIPDGTEGLEVYLYDSQTGVKTNMLTQSYSVSLPAGTENDRFMLQVSRSNQSTAIVAEKENTDGTKTVKFIQRGQLFIQKDNQVYNAQGNRIQ